VDRDLRSARREALGGLLAGLAISVWSLILLLAG
jgi:hypothetical protein